MLSCQTKWGIRASRIFIIILINGEKGQFDILHDISENVNLVQLMDSVGNVNNELSIVGYWIFDSNYKKALLLKLDSLNLICPPSVGEVIFFVFESVFHIVRYINNTGKLIFRTILNQWVHIVTDAIKNNLINTLKIIACCGFVWQCYDIPVVKGAYDWPVRAIGDR